MNAEQLELVTAYVDGEASADERAVVEADAELMTEVDRQRSLRNVLHDVGPPSAESREAAVAAALAVFDEQHTPATLPSESAPRSDVTAPTNVVPLEQRRRLRWMQGLGAAAAAVVVVVAGVVIATRGGDGDGTTADELKPAATTSSERESDTAPEATAAIVTTTVGPEIMAAAPATTVLAEAASAADVADAAESQEAAEDAATGSAPGEGAPAESPTMPAPAPAPPTTATARLVVIATEDDLVDLADAVKEELPALDDARQACADQQLKADATYDADDGTQHPILIVVVDDETLGALSLDDCEVVLEAER